VLTKPPRYDLPPFFHQSKTLLRFSSIRLIGPVWRPWLSCCPSWNCCFWACQAVRAMFRCDVDFMFHMHTLKREMLPRGVVAKPSAAVSPGSCSKDSRMDSEPRAAPVVSWCVKASQPSHSNTFQPWQGWQKHLHI